MSTYGDLQDRVADDLNRTDLSDQIRDQLQLAIVHYGRIPFWFNEATTTLTASNSASFLAVPSDYLDTVDLYINVGNYPLRLIPKSLREVVEYRPTAGSQPTSYCYYGDRFELDCQVNTQYTFPLYYIKSLGTISATSDVSLWTTQGEDLIVARAEKVLYRDVLKDMGKFSVAKDAENEAKKSLLGFRDRKIGTGHAEPWGY